jgi:hypothetical protein
VSICVHWEVVLDTSSTCWRGHNERFAEQEYCFSNFT